MECSESLANIYAPNVESQEDKEKKKTITQGGSQREWFWFWFDGSL
jgi:hypothetical protein